MTKTNMKSLITCLVAAIALSLAVQKASAFTEADRAAAFSAWTNAFYYTSGGNGYFRVSEGTGNLDYFWVWAYEIATVVRAQPLGLASTAMVNQACAGFTNSNGADYSWNQWNDDLGAVSMMFIDAYEVTGNPSWRERAKYAFDLAYNRGIDPVTGGMYETTTNGPAYILATETSAPALIVAYKLALDLPDASYMTKARGLYTYLTNYVVNLTTGMVLGVPGGGTTTGPGDYGWVMICAKLMGDTNTMIRVNNYMTNNWGILLSGGEDGSAGLAVRDMGYLGLDNDFANQICDNAWSWRNSRNLVSSWDHRPNDSTALTTWNCLTVVMGMLAPVPKAPPTLPATAAEVVGGQVIFTAAFPNGWSYQWQKVSSGVTNSISGATGTTLTLANLQLTDTATYQCRATSGTNVQISVPATLTVSSVPGAVSNVVVLAVAQTGPGYGASFTPSWNQVSGSLLTGLTPSVAGGNFNLEAYYAARSANSLTAGGGLTVTPQGPNYPFPATVYQTFTNTFTATAGTETLSFIGLDPYGPGIAAGQTVFIDNVRIVSLSGASVTVPDGGFETPGGISSHQYNPSGAPWTFTGQSGSSGSGIVANGGAFQNTNAPEGVQAGLLQGHGMISQNITGLTPGTTYNVIYSAAQRPGYIVQTWVVTMGDIPTPAGSAAYNYTNYTLRFTAAASSQIVTFSGTDLANSSDTVFIDNVTMVATNGTVVTVPNGSFESPVLGTGNAQYNPSGGLWTFSGASPSGSGIVANGSGFGNPNAPNGVQAAFLQGKGTITQTITGLTPGMVYNISFSAAQRSAWNVGSETCNLSVNGAVIGSSATVLGSRVITGNNYVTCGNNCGAGSNLVYTLPTSPNGYDLTNITVYGGWADNERDAQAYSVYYSTVSAPNTFNLLGTVNYNPVNTNRNPSYETSGYATVGAQAATRVTLTPASGVLASNVAALKFDFASSASENGYCGYAQITAYGSLSGISINTSNQFGSTSTYPFTPGWTVPSANNLILGQAPSSSSGNFNAWPATVGTRNVNSLTDGGNLAINSVASSTTSTNYVVCGNDGSGSNVVYTLTGSANGYTLTNITVYGGWQDSGRDAQAYTVYYATVAAPTTFIALASVNYNPVGVPGSTPSATRVVITPSVTNGVLARNVAALKFDFTSPASENGDCGYAEVAAYGTPTTVNIATTNQVGSANTYPFTPNWTVPSANNLLLGKSPSSSSGNFNAWPATVGTRNVGSLTDGGNLAINSVAASSGNTTSTNYVVCGNDGSGSNVVYTLTGSANGYTLTNITVYGGWQDAGRDAQAYTVYYATIAAPTTFIALATVNYNPAGVPGSTPSATRVTLTPPGGSILAANVAALKFDFTSPASENGDCGYAEVAAYGTPTTVNIAMTNQIGSASTYPFTPSWTVSSANNLLLGKTPSSSSGNFNAWPASVGARSVNSLTDGGNLSIGSVMGSGGGNNTTSTNYVVCGNDGSGSNVVYTLTGSANGYTLTNITVYGGWQDAGRDAQAYTVYYATIAAPTTFIALATVNYNPVGVPGSTPSATRVTLTPPGGSILAANVAVLKFDFTSPASENGDCGYAEVAVYGSQSPALPIMAVPPLPLNLSLSTTSGSDLILQIDGNVIGKTYEVQSTTNLVSPVWVTERSFEADAASVSITNSISMDTQKFYRVMGY